jgi:hypothetical protein
MNATAGQAEIRAGGRAAAGELRQRGVLEGARGGLGPVQRADHPRQLIITGPGEPVTIPGGVLGEAQQHPAAGREVQRLPGPEPAGRAGVLTPDPPRRPRHPRPRRPTLTPTWGTSASRGSPAAYSASAACSAAFPAATRRDSARNASRSTSSGSAGSAGSGHHPRSDSGSGGGSPLSDAASHAAHRSGSASGSTPGGTGRHPSASSIGSPATSHPQVGSGCGSPGACAPRARVSSGPRLKELVPGHAPPPVRRNDFDLIEHDSESTSLRQA